MPAEPRAVHVPRAPMKARGRVAGHHLADWLDRLACAAASNAAIVTATYSGHMTFTSAEARGAPWGYDGFGNYIVDDAYSATIVYNTSAGVTSYWPGGEQSQDQRPGFATETFT